MARTPFNEQDYFKSHGLATPDQAAERMRRASLEAMSSGAMVPGATMSPWGRILGSIKNQKKSTPKFTGKHEDFLKNFSEYDAVKLARTHKNSKAVRNWLQSGMDKISDELDELNVSYKKTKDKGFLDDMMKKGTHRQKYRQALEAMDESGSWESWKQANPELVDVGTDLGKTVDVMDAMAQRRNAFADPFKQAVSKKNVIQGYVSENGWSKTLDNVGDAWTKVDNKAALERDMVSSLKQMTVTHADRLRVAHFLDAAEKAAPEAQKKFFANVAEALLESW